MITVDALAASLGLELTFAAGRNGGSRPLTWAHVIELADPWNWIGPGELILTTGLGIPRPAAQPEWLGRVARSGANGLILAPAPGSRPLTRDALAEADAAGFPVLTASFDARFTEIAREIINASLAREAQRLSTAQRAFGLYAAALERDGATGESWEDRLGGIARALGIGFEITSSGGELLLRRGALANGDGAPGALGARADDPAEIRLGAHAVFLRLASASPDGSRAGLDPALRAGFATVVSIELRRLVAERRVRLASAGLVARHWLHSGGLAEAGAAGLLAALGWGSDAEQPTARWAVIRDSDPDTGADLLLAPTLWGAEAAGFSRLGHFAVLLRGRAGAAPALLAACELRELAVGFGPEFAVGQGPVAGGSLPEAHAAAADSLRVAVLRAERDPGPGGSGSGSGTGAGPVAAELVLPGSSTQREALDGLLLGPLRAHDAEHGSELLVTLDAYFAADRSAARTAEALHIHRHTLAYRLRTIGRLTGLDPTSTAAIAQFWVALESARLAPPEIARPA